MRPLKTNVDEQFMQAVFLHIGDLDAESELEEKRITGEERTDDDEIKNAAPEANAC